jgi:hypothetical protein
MTSTVESNYYKIFSFFEVFLKYLSDKNVTNQELNNLNHMKISSKAAFLSLIHKLLAKIQSPLKL